ncbi:MAG: endopeptidase La [Bacillota bacterium]|nr:endopeptidase La [Bacillota bacterium]MDD3298779.1 endopeptidase La [Bacillota bacterium]MDD3851379.1 endopeptidase La [Bacillota bacterium]MDD4708200.1 endopeptidase La [Bacillota bacterium]
MEQSKKTKVLPLLPLRGISVFPYMMLHFDVGRDKSVSALDEAMVKDQLIFLVSQRDAATDEPTANDYYQVGTISKIKQLLKLPGDTIRVLVEGIHRARIVTHIKDAPFFEVEVEEFVDPEDVRKDTETEALMRAIFDSFEEYVKLTNRAAVDTLITVGSVEEPARFADIVVSNLSLKISQKQQVLEAFDHRERLRRLHTILIKELDILRVEKKINLRVKRQIDKMQREYYLKEQLKAIQKELGEDDGVLSEVEAYRNRIKEAGLPEDTEEKVLKEADRLLKLAPASAETGVIRGYLDWILELPWDKETEDNLDLKFARKVLEEDHYGLEKVKERVLEYLAIRQLATGMKGPILCLVGPPGVGKTSVGRSIARAINRKFVRMSLGGVRDEAEIRGHRRTYVGAIPGRIIYSMRQAGSKNPVFLLDEVDKMSHDFRGDPASAMLEVLDSEQNNTFRDHFLEVPFDLSKVMFVTTANTVDTIPRPLLDRMEVIYISSYTEEEKLNIAIKYLLPKQLKEHGLKKENLLISEQTVRDIINYYTREAGVRNLERRIADVCRKAAKQLVEDKKKRVRVTGANLNKFLGIPAYRHEKIKEGHETGMATGLAWTPVGGETLFIEVTTMKGSGKLVLTGQLGDVMKESARAGISYIRSRTEKLGIDPNFYQELDIHIHIPEGAIPKDGPSAGITIATAVISALTGVPVRKDIAMTGEITLRGRILPVGGIKEKCLAANRAGISKVLIPVENEKDLEEIPVNVKRKMEFVTVEHMDSVLEHALVRVQGDGSPGLTE